MSDNDLTVRFGGDTSALNASIEQARRAVVAFSPAAINQATAGFQPFNRAIQDARDNSSGLTSTLRDLTTIVAGGIYIVEELGGAFVSLTETIGRASAATAKFTISNTFGAELQAIRSLDSAMIGYFTSAAYAQRGAEMFAVANDGVSASIGRTILAAQKFFDVSGAIKGLYNSVRLYTSGLDQTQLSAIAAAGGLDAFENALARARQPQLPFLVDLTRQLETIPGMSDAAATSIIALMTTIPSYTAEASNVLTQFLQTYAATADEAVALTKKISDAIKDPTNGGKTLGDLASQVQNVAGQLKLAQTFAAQLAPTQAVAMYDRIEEQLKNARALIAAQDADHRRVYSTLILENGEEEGAAQILRDQLETDQKRTSELNAQITALEVQRQGWVSITEEAKKQAAFVDAIAKASTPTSRINDLEEQNKTLGGNSRRDDVDITAMQKDAAIRVAILEAANQTDEGILGVLNVMSNRLHASYGNYGSDLGAVLSKPNAFTAYDPAKMAAIDPSGYQYQRVAGLYDKVFGDNPDDDPTGGATHYYNLSRAAPDWGPSMGNQHKIGDHKFGNPDGPPVPSDQDATVGKEAIEQTNTALREQNALLAGGTAEEKLKAEQAQANLSGARDELAQAQALVEVRRKAVEAAKDGTPKEQTTAAAALTQAEQELADKRVALAKSTNALQVAQAREGSAEREALEIAGVNAEQAQWAKGTAGYEDAEKQKVEINQRYARQRAADETETENASFDEVKRGFAARQQLVRDQAAANIITSRQALSEQLALLAQEQEAYQRHFAALEAANAQWPQVVRKYAQQAAVAQNQILAEQVKQTEAAAREMEASFRQHFEGIGSNIAGSLSKIIEGTGNLRQLMQSAARYVEESFVQAGVKVATDWAAHQAYLVAQTVLSQTQQTAAVAAGEEARLGLTATGEAEQVVVLAGTALRSILASAGEAAAGVFAFLAPIMGPAAVGPAAAAQTAVMGFLPQLATGAWSLAGDTVAQLHAGEMVVPATFASSLRSAVAGGGAGGGGDMHVHLNIAHTSYGSRSRTAIMEESNDMAEGLFRHMKVNRPKWQDAIKGVGP